MPPSSRRDFLKQSALAGSALGLPSVWSNGAAARGSSASTHVTARGRVHSGGDGIEGVRVTDGLNVVTTDENGAYQIQTTNRREFVYLTLPDGYKIPQREVGTALFYRRIEPDEEGHMRADFELEPRRERAGRHAFLVLADPQTEDQYEVDRFHSETVPDVQDLVAQHNDIPIFGVGCGDIMFDNLELFPEYEEAARMMGIPFFQVVGNHDIIFDAPTEPGSVATFQDHFGPGHYSFDLDGVHYVALDDVFWAGNTYFGYVSDVQLEWLRQDLAALDERNTVVVFAHIPPLSTRDLRRGEDEPSPRGSVGNRSALYSLLDDYDAHIITGHVHENEHIYRHGLHEHVVGTVCGAWWSGDICYDGTPNGYAVYEVSGESVEWRYKATGKPDEHQMRLYPPGSEPEAPDEMVANVWDADREWEIVWYEDGVKTGRMSRRVGTDPRSEDEHRGDEVPERRPWVDPVPTEHLYYAPIAHDTRVHVEAVDRFGRIYDAPLDG